MTLPSRDLERCLTFQGVTELIIGSSEVAGVGWRLSWIDGLGLRDVIDPKVALIQLILSR